MALSTNKTGTNKALSKVITKISFFFDRKRIVPKKRPIVLSELMTHNKSQNTTLCTSPCHPEYEQKQNEKRYQEG